MLRNCFHQEAPFVFILKCFLGVAMVLVFDNYTGNADRVTTTFVVTLMMVPTVHQALAHTTIMTAGIIGGFYGMGLYCLLHELFKDPYAQNWSLLISVPVGVALTIYTMFLLGLNDPLNVNSALFSVVLIQLVPFDWIYVASIFPFFEGNIYATTSIIRVLALATAIDCGFVVSSSLSVIFSPIIFNQRLAILEITVGVPILVFMTNFFIFIIMFMFIRANKY